jgi:hypothetical protein
MNEGGDFRGVDLMDHVDADEDDDDDLRLFDEDEVGMPWLEDNVRESRDSRMEEISFLFVILFEFVCIKDGIIRSLEELLMEEVTQSLFDVDVAFVTLRASGSSFSAYSDWDWDGEMSQQFQVITSSVSHEQLLTYKTRDL